MKEKKARVEDALHATARPSRKASSPARRGYLRARANIKGLKGDNPDQEAASRSCCARSRSRCARSCRTPATSVGRGQQGRRGQGQLRLQRGHRPVGDMVEMGVLDPTK